MIFCRFTLPVDFGKRSAGPGRARTHDQAAACNELLVQSRSTNPGLPLSASCVQRRAWPMLITNFLPDSENSSKRRRMDIASQPIQLSMA